MKNAGDITGECQKHMGKVDINDTSGKTKGERMLEELRKGRKNVAEIIEEINTDDN